MATWTVGTTGRNYSTLQAAWDALPSTLTESYIFECYKDTPFTAGFNTSASTKVLGANTVIIRPATGQGYRDHANKLTNALRYNDANGVSFAAFEGVMFTNGHAGVTLDGLAIKSTQSGSRALDTWGPVKNCLLQAIGVNTTTPVLLVNAAVNVFNNLIIQSGSAGRGVSDDGGATLKGNTIVYIGSGTSTLSGVMASSGNATIAQNNAVFGFTAAFNVFGSGNYHSSSDYNATNLASIGTGTGGNDVVSLTFANQFQAVGTLGSEDLRVKSGAGLIAEGWADAAITPDFIGQTRSGSTPTIGAWEFAAASPTQALLTSVSTAGHSTPGSNRFIGL